MRDSYLGIPEKINDLDVWADFSPMRKPGETLEDLGKRIKQKLSQNGVDGVNIAVPSDPPDGHEVVIIMFNYNGHPATVTATGSPVPIENGIRGADAPINSIIMNSKGEVFSHPDFEEHARERVYEPFAHVTQEKARQRFEKLKQKILGLVMRRKPDSGPVAKPRSEPDL